MNRLLVLLVLLIPSLVFSQGYPNKPVRIVVPFAPGGASDFVARILQPKMNELLGQQVVVENKAGASGNIGVAEAAKSPPDGYTVFLGNVGTIAINPGLFTKAGLNPMKDFIAITQVVDVPGAFVVHPALQANTVQEVVAIAKAHPGKLNYASPGSGSQNRLEMEVFRKSAGGLDMVHVPYKGGAGPAVAGLVGGETHMMFVTASSALPHVKSGRVRLIAVTSAKRMDAFPGTPTMAEAGFPDLTSGSWQGIFVPAGTPKEVVDKLYAVMMDTMKAPEVRQRLTNGGVDVVTSAPGAFSAYVAKETARWAQAVKEAGATAD